MRSGSTAPLHACDDGQGTESDGSVPSVPDRPVEPVGAARQPHLERADRDHALARQAADGGHVLLRRASGAVDGGGDRAELEVDHPDRRLPRRQRGPGPRPGPGGPYQPGLHDPEAVRA